MQDKLIEMRHVGMRYTDRRVLENVDFTLREGDFVAVTGPNGGGKTTFLRLMLKLLKPTEGEVEYYHGGHPVKRLSIGYLPQKNNIDTRFPVTVRETIRQGLLRGILNRRSREDEARYREVADLCGVSGYEDRPIGELSGGELQRTLLGRAIIMRPELLVLDEPLSYVDKEFERQIYTLMERLSRETTILLVSHEMSVISEMSNRRLTVKDGHITEW